MPSIISQAYLSRYLKNKPISYYASITKIITNRNPEDAATEILHKLEELDSKSADTYCKQLNRYIASMKDTDYGSKLLTHLVYKLQSRIMIINNHISILRKGGQL